MNLTVMQRVEQDYKEGTTSRRELAKARSIFAESALTPDDYEHVKGSLAKMWRPFFEESKAAKKHKMLGHLKFPEAVERFKSEGKMQMTHTKISLKNVLKIVDIYSK